MKIIKGKKIYFKFNPISDYKAMIGIETRADTPITMILTIPEYGDTTLYVPLITSSTNLYKSVDFPELYISQISSGRVCKVCDNDRYIDLFRHWKYRENNSGLKELLMNKLIRKLLECNNNQEIFSTETIDNDDEL